MDWREVGRQLRQEEERFGERMDTIEDPDESRLNAEFVHALLLAARGNTTPIVECLRSDRPLPEFFRKHLRDYFRGKFSRGRGQPRDELLHLAASDALNFYRLWRAKNDRLGISDWGHRNAMKDEAIRFIQERYPVFEGIDAEKVRDLMDRPRSRRK